MIENDKLEAIWGHRLLDEGFLGIPNIIVRNYRQLGIEHGEFGFICNILTYQHKANDPYPSQETIAQNMNCSVRQIQKWVESLSAKGLVSIGQRKHIETKTWSTNVYNFKSLIDKALIYVGESPLSASLNDYEIIYRNPGVPGVRSVPPVPEVQTEPSVLEVRVDPVPQVRTNRSLNRSKDDEDEVKDARANESQTHENSQFDTHKTLGEIRIPEVLQNRAWEGQEQKALIQSIPQALRPCTPTPTDPDQPALDGQAASMSLTAPTVATLTPTDDIYQQVDRRMTMHLGRVYIAKQGDYRAIVDLRASGVPGEFILAGIDYTFANFSDKHPKSFLYCAEIIKQRWASELEKHAPLTPEATQSPTPKLSRRKQPSTPTLVSQGSAGSTANGGHDKRYGAFYELFPDV